MIDEESSRSFHHLSLLFSPSPLQKYVSMNLGELGSSDEVVIGMRQTCLWPSFFPWGHEFNR